MGIIHMVKFLLFCISRQMSFSQVYVRNKVVFPVCNCKIKAYPEAQLTMETELTTSEEHN